MVLKKPTLSVDQLKNIVDVIVPNNIKFPEIQAHTYYMLLELNIEFET